MKKNWKEVDIALIVKGGTAEEFKTGDWRSEKPLYKSDKCKQCLQCWLFCPDSSIIVKDGKMVGIDFDHCKGCGICSKVCPFDAIDMVQEEK